MASYQDEEDIAQQEELIDQEEDLTMARLEFLDSLAQGSREDLMVSHLYSKQRARRVEIFGIELDEMWSFVQNKTHKVWIWMALNPANRQIVGLHLGGRTKEDAQKLWESIPPFFRENVGFFSDYWKAYQAVFDPETHFAVGKHSGLTNHIERFNGTMRQRVSRLLTDVTHEKSNISHVGVL